MLEGAGHVAEVGRRAQDVGVGPQDVDSGGGEGGAGHDVDRRGRVAGLPGAGQDGVEQAVERRRRRVVDDQEDGHRAILAPPGTRGSSGR